jgi:hypothetical protein
MRPHPASGVEVGGTPASGAMLPSPARAMFGSDIPPTARATLPSVLLPTSP